MTPHSILRPPLRFPPRTRFHRATADILSRARIHVAGRPHLRRHATRALKGLGGGLGYAAFVEPRWIERTHVEMHVPGLPSALEGYRIVHLTDIHHNFVSGRRFLERLIDMSNALDPDLYLITGDFITHNPGRLDFVMKVLSHLHAADGCLATRGNHDYVVPLAEMRRACEHAGIRLLENEHVVVDARRHRLVRSARQAPADASFIVAGVGDLWEGTCNVSQALQGAPTHLPRLLMAHNPWTAEVVHASHRVALQLSGHTHGGQVRPFNKPLRLLADSGLKYSAGLVQGPHCPVYISRGVGTSALRFRWNCRPEIALITLRGDE